MKWELIATPALSASSGATSGSLIAWALQMLFGIHCLWWLAGGCALIAAIFGIALITGNLFHSPEPECAYRRRVIATRRPPCAPRQLILIAR